MTHTPTSSGVSAEAETDFIAEAITEAFGERCPEYAEGCAACDAWKQYDELRAPPRPSSDTIGGGELVLWLLSEAKRAEDFAPRYQAASPFRIVWEERAKKLRECAAALQIRAAR